MKNKNSFIYLSLIFFFSCNNLETDIKLESTGSYNEIIVVVEDKIWEEEVGEKLKKIFETEIEGLPQPEQMFNLIQINSGEFNRLFKTHKNIIFVSKNVTSSFSKNKWAEDQIVIYINSESSEEEFIRNCIEAFNLIDKKELENIKSLYQSGHNKKVSELIKKEFDIDIYLPTEYDIPILDTLKKDGILVADFHSFNENQDLLKYIIVFEFEKKKNINQEVLIKADSILEIYILGEQEKSYVQIDKRILVSEKEGIYKGIWNLKNGFMAGPFVIKSHEKEDRIIVSMGLVFYPNHSKRKFVRVFEAIL